MKLLREKNGETVWCGGGGKSSNASASSGWLYGNMSQHEVGGGVVFWEGCYAAVGR